MNTHGLSRKQFITGSIAGLSSLLLPTQSLFAQDQKQEKPAPLKPELVKEFVGVCHGKIDRAKEMLANEHLLLHSSWDWGGGDFESGIEAAGHVGNKEIAAFLLANGARYNIYLACMLGHLDIVKQVLTFNPGLLNSKGAHGFTMLHHAQKGGEEAKSVADFLQSLGAKETKVDFYARR
jgi:hypothetical protein